MSNRNLWLFLGVVVVMQFGYPVTFWGRVPTMIYMAGYAGMIYFGLNLVRDERVRMSPFVILAGLTVLGGGWFSFDQSSRWALLAMLASVGIFQLALLGSTFRFLIRPRSGTTVTQLILLAVAAYLLLGGVFAVTGNVLETMAPGSFVDNAAPDRPLVWQGLLYASYVTLSTLGYGEILPVSAWARSLASLEAVTGTLFLAVVIARLVGAYSAGSSEISEPAEPKEAAASTDSESPTDRQRSG